MRIWNWNRQPQIYYTYLIRIVIIVPYVKIEKYNYNFERKAEHFIEYIL